MNPYNIIVTRRYKTALKRFSRHKDFNLKKLEHVITMLARGEKLAPIHRDHQLTGELKLYRECHIEHDILLIYQKHDNMLILLLVDLGSHSSLFR